MSRKEAMKSFIEAGEQLQHEDDCPHAEGKWDGGCTCKSDPRRLEVNNTSAKKSEVVDRTISERKYCAIDQFYYSEMFTCPICYGVQLENERIINLLESKLCWCVGQPLNKDNGKEELMKHMNCDWEAMMIEYHVALIKGEQK